MSQHTQSWNDRSPLQLVRSGYSSIANNRYELNVMFLGDDAFLGSVDSSGGRAPFMAGCLELGYVLNAQGPFTTQPGSFAANPQFENRHACAAGGTMANARLGTGPFAGTGGVRQMLRDTYRDVDIVFVLFGAEDMTGAPDIRIETRNRFDLLLREIFAGINERTNENKRSVRVIVGMSGIWRVLGSAPYTDVGWDSRRLGLLEALANLRAAGMRAEYWGYSEAVRSAVNLTTHAHYTGTFPRPWAETLYGASMIAALDIPGVGLREAVEAIATAPAYRPFTGAWDSVTYAATSATFTGSTDNDLVIIDRVYAGVTGAPATPPNITTAATAIVSLIPANPQVDLRHVQNASNWTVNVASGTSIGVHYTRHRTFPPQFVG